MVAKGPYNCSRQHVEYFANLKQILKSSNQILSNVNYY